MSGSFKKLVEGCDCGVEVAIRDHVANIDLWYPRSTPNHVEELEIGLIDVRASDGIRVSYDFKRDGWVVKQQRYVGTEKHHQLQSADDFAWEEVGFFQSWALEEADEAPD